MASITSLMKSSSSTSSLYGNRNVISGLASGMDTEAMIENSVSGYKAKITSLQQKMTMLQWKQDAYRSLITQMNNVLNKYMDYTSSTNLFSASFFNKAINTVASGANASKVAVSGKGTSNVQIDRIKQLAQAASYSVSAKGLATKGATTEAIQWDKDIETSGVSGSVTLQYGGAGDSSKGSKITLSFGEDEVFKTKQELADAINKQLENKQINGKPANEYITAWVDGDKISLQDIKGNHFEITGVSGDMEKVFETGSGKNIEGKVIQDADLVTKTSRADYLKDQTINVTLDGKSKTIRLGDIIDDNFNKLSSAEKNKKLAQGLQDKIGEAFGKNKVTVSTDASGALQFGAKDGSVLKVSGNEAVNESMGLGEGGYSNVLQNSWTLDRVLGDSVTFTADKNEDGEYIDANGNVVEKAEDAAQVANLTINGVDIKLNKNDTIQSMTSKINASEAGVEVKYSTLTGEFSMVAKETGADSKIEISGELGNALFGTPKEINETTTFNDVFGANLAPGEKKYFRFEYNGPGNSFIFQVSADDTMEDVLAQLQEKAAGYGESVTFNKETGRFDYTRNNGDTVEMKISDYNSYLEPDEAYYKSSGTYTAGQDAIFNVTVNGKEMELTRSSNNVELDGYNVTLKEAFGYDKDGNEVETEAITFKTNTDSDKIVDTIKSFVKDYNEMVIAIRNAYTTERIKNTQGNEYQPLTDDDKEDMSESAIKAYEEKAKTGLLYADPDLANLYAKLTSAVQGTGGMGSVFRSIGLNVNYNEGLTTLDLDEDKLRSALESDPDKVKNAFVQTTSSGATANGLMQGIRSTLEQYGKTSIGNPGILVKKAGTTLSSYSLNNNELNDQINNMQKEIEKWQERMSDRVDYYTNQFTHLEMLISQMNSQSSMLAGLSGGM